jgi:polyisoprenoid-binding protein YceI
MHLAVDDYRCAPDGPAVARHCTARVSTTLQRHEFDMGFGYPLVGDDVHLTFVVHAMRETGDGEAASR